MVRSKSKDSFKEDSCEYEISMSSLKKKPISNRTSRPTSPKSDISTNEDASSTVVPPLRVGGRMKKAKIVFDPSDNYIPKRKIPVGEKSKPKPSSNTASSSKSGSSIVSADKKSKIKIPSTNTKGCDDKKNIERDDSSSKATNYYSELCLICMKKGKENEILTCSIMYCQYKAHLKCLNLGGDDFDLTLLQNNWQCPYCKTCVVCFENADAGILTICSICGDAYHSICHTPRITLDEYPFLDSWKCMHCARLKVKIKNTNLGHAIPFSLKPKTYGNKSYYADSRKTINLEANDVMELDEHVPLTPPPSQPSSNSDIQPNDDSKCDTSSENNLKDDKEEFIGFSDIESSEQLKKFATTSNLLNIKRRNSEFNILTEEIINETLKRKSTEGSGNNNVPKKKISEIIAMKLKENETINNVKHEIISIPEINDWTCADVCHYFKKFFPDCSKIFEDQQIDGSAVLLLKRSDVINGLNLKLGPAIKLYRHILMLQTKSNDPRQSWL